MDEIRYATLDMSGPWRLTFDTMIPDAVQAADPFHLIKLANSKLDEFRRRVQNETLGDRGRKTGGGTNLLVKKINAPAKVPQPP